MAMYAIEIILPGGTVYELCRTLDIHAAMAVIECLMNDSAKGIDQLTIRRTVDLPKT